jgi:3-oxoacyl-[acyl-carrier protein] reductase
MNRIVLVTGAARGIGAAVARALARDHDHVVINYLHSRQPAEQLARQLSQDDGVDCLALKADVSDEQQVDQMVLQIEQRLGPVDVLVNNAGIDLSDLFHRKTAEQFRRTMDVNVIGAFNCARRVSSGMLARHYGRIINIASTNGINTYYPMSVDYDASKAALISLTHDLAVAWAPDIHVNAVAPGFIGTQSELDGYDEAFLREECEKILVKRYGRPEEVAALVRFLASDQADFINNSVIRIDGGQNGSC